MSAQLALMEEAVSSRLSNPELFQEAVAHLKGSEFRQQYEAVNALINDPSLFFDRATSDAFTSIRQRIAALVQAVSSPSPVVSSPPVAEVTVLDDDASLLVAPVSTSHVSLPTPVVTVETAPVTAHYVPAPPTRLQQMSRSFSPARFPGSIEIPRRGTLERAAIEKDVAAFRDKIVVAATSHAFALLPSRAKRLFFWELLQAVFSSDDLINDFSQLIAKLLAKRLSDKLTPSEDLALQWTIDSLVPHAGADSGVDLLEKQMLTALDKPSSGTISFVPSKYTNISDDQWDSDLGVVTTLDSAIPTQASLRANGSFV